MPTTRIRVSSGWRDFSDDLGHLFGLLQPVLVAKTSLRSNLGRPFDDEETNPKPQYGSIRVAPSQKGHKGSHNS
jgi:hypothetical protein